MFYQIKQINKEQRKNLKWLDIKQFILKYTQIENKENFKNLKLDCVKYFTAHISDDNKGSRKNQQTYLKALETIKNVKIIHGNFKNTYPKGYLWDSVSKKIAHPKKMVTIVKPEEKESDVNIGIHIINDCHENKTLKSIIIVSSDTDLTPVLKMVKEKFPDKKIMHIRMKKNGSISMKRYAHITKRVTCKFLENSQFPETLYKGKIKIEKPDEWKEPPKRNKVSKP